MALALSIYPTLLDSFYWLKKIPSDEKIQDFIDKINKVQKPIPPAALKGVQLEGLINAKLDGLDLL